ncbi:hypothetical protein [Streptomyces sp. I05A-00742]|uniref:hypothetical protein n=1 Tax=Streptomyces sp. I05A-00742 TaxID=2732853 RepID=UPI0014896D32|nr:hypothetical protein [Streptomyces sp. I05A-00742]
MSDSATRNSIGTAILRWVDEMAGHPRRSLELFLASDVARSMRVGQELAEHTAAFMETRGLLTVRRAWSHTPVHLALTLEGRDCLYQGGDLEAYVRDREPGTRMEFNIYGGQGNQFGNVGETITQTNTVQPNLEVQDLAALADLLRRCADDPQVHDDEADELRDIAADLDDDIQDGEVEPGTARRRLTRITRVATRLVPALSLEVTAAADQLGQLLG